MLLSMWTPAECNGKSINCVLLSEQKTTADSTDSPKKYL